jgi:hypothetical protein
VVVCVQMFKLLQGLNEEKKTQSSLDVLFDLHLNEISDNMFARPSLEGICNL